MAASHGLSGIPHFDTKVRIEELVRQSSVPITTIIRPATFMEFLIPAKSDVANGTVSFLMHPDQAMQFVATVDIGRVVSKIFALPAAYRGRSLALAGDELTGNQMATAVAAHSGSTVRYTRIPISVLRDEMPLLSRLADLVDAGPLAGDVVLPELRTEFPFLHTFPSWLSQQGAII